MTRFQSSMHEFHSYRDILAAFSERDLHLIAQTKRFMECLGGDEKFRKSVEADPEDQNVHDHLRKIGVKFSAREFAPLWSQADEFTAYLQWLMEPSKIAQPDLDALELKQWPLMQLWTKWIKANGSYARERFSNISPIRTNPRFHAWRQRRIASVNSELGSFSNRIDHSILAFELSRGCSMGCWFCGLAAEKLSGIFDYTPENRTLWRDIVQTGVALFGSAMNGTICYHGTEPYDNPHYLDFLKDYREIAGSIPRTTTAVPLKDPDWVRGLIDLYHEDLDSGLRFSVLNVSTLRRIHETYTPDELRDVSLEMQMKNSLLGKVASGRLLHADRNDLRGQISLNVTSSIPQGSLGCISGFLVNMVDHTIRLMSPCYANERWPNGYRVFGEATFENADDYRATLEWLIEQYMLEHVTPDVILAFRDDLQCRLNADGFTLLSPHKKHHVKGNGFHRQLGELLMQGDKTYQELVASLTHHNGTSFFDVSRIVTKLFDRGLLDETLIECRA